jgi:SAM-dependent methyltransferase
MFILVPGRHHLLTNFQFNYLSEICKVTKVDAIIFAVTSANHSNTRRNPLPFYLRALAIEEFGKSLGVPCFIYGIDDVGNVKNFSGYTVKRIHHESEGQFDLGSSNTQVVCSTPVLEMYENDGFIILTAELEDRKTWKHHTSMPWDIVERIATIADWKNDNWIVSRMHPASIDVWDRYRLGGKIQMLFRDKMISDDGDITTTRDYNTYVRQMDEIAVLKYEETASFIRPGRVGDIGCAVGSWIKLACKDTRWRECDFYGIEVARHLFDICQQRKHNGEFANPFVFFSQRNAVTGLAFDKGSMNTIHTSSLTHEIESYGSREELLSFIRNRYDELAPGGVWINRDVVGPADRERTVLMKLSKVDGRNDDFDKKHSTRESLSDYLKGLSTYGRFRRFANDFRAKEGYTLKYELTTDHVRLSMKDACEFMSRKDYTDNWESEMHETFCFWDFDDWKRHLADVGFSIAAGSGAYTNQWIVNNRLRGKVELFDEALSPIEYPVTNMLMIAEKN